MNHTLTSVAEKPNFLLHVNISPKIFFSLFIVSLIFMFIWIKRKTFGFHSSVWKCFESLWFDLLQFTSCAVEVWLSFSYNNWYIALSVVSCSWLWSQWDFFSGAFVQTVVKLFWGYSIFLIWEAQLLFALKLLIFLKKIFPCSFMYRYTPATA